MLTWVQSIPSNVVLCGLAAIAATLYGVAALWAVGGRAGWLARTAPVALLLATLVPIGAYELLAVFGAQVAIVIAWVLMVRLGRAFRDSRNQGESRRGALRTALRREWGERARFHLRDVLLAVLLAGVVLAIVRFAEPVLTDWWGLAGWSRFVGAGALLGLVTVTAESMIFGRAHWVFRVAALILVSAALCGWLHWAMDLDAIAGISCSIAIVTFMTLARLACWTPWRRSTEGRQHSPPVSEETPTRPWLRRLSRGTVCTTAFLGLLVLIPAYWIMLPTTRPVAETLPDPNGYDELVQLSQAVNWSAIPSNDVDVATVSACRQFVQDNTDTLALIREALAKPSVVPIFDNFRDFSELRSLARALMMEAKLADAEGRHADAVKIYLDLVDMGDTTSLGGLVIDKLVGMAFEGIGLDGIEPVLGQLDVVQLALLRQRLEASVARQEPMERVVKRGDAYDSSNYGWLYRLVREFKDSDARTPYEVFFATGHRSEARLRLILAEAALRQYVLQHGSPPESLAALVPEYLSAVPQDPYGAGPLVYRTTDDGYLLYSVGTNGSDDGGQRVTTTEAFVENKGDLFFDTRDE